MFTDLVLFIKLSVCKHKHETSHTLWPQQKGMQSKIERDTRGGGQFAFEVRDREKWERETDAYTDRR